MCGAEFAAAADRDERPNVVLFLVDDLGYGDLAGHGNPHVETPHIDAFARDGVEFSRFYVSPVCHPTRASLMTGRHTARTFRNVSFHMDPEEVTVAEMLKAAGYKTAHFGKWHLGEEPHESPLAQGFDEVITLGPGLMSSAGGALPAKSYFDPELFHNGRPQKYRGYCMDVYTTAAIDFIRENRDHPLFVYLPTNLIHTPMVAPPELAAKYRARGLNEDLAAAYGMIESTDTNFGRLRGALKELALEETTLLIFTSDNGAAIYKAHEIERDAGLHGMKGTVYEGGIRAPCVMRWPAGFSGRTKVDRIAAHIDVLPTILEACGVAAPAGVRLDGRSLLPLLRDPAAPWTERTLVIQCNSNGPPTRGLSFAAIGQRWKLVQPCGTDKNFFWLAWYSIISAAQGRGERTVMDGVPRLELYDLIADPGERQNEAAQHPEIVEQLQRQYNAWFDDIEAHGRWIKPQPAGSTATER
jgi:arylsulfatase A-like enzyme